MANKGNTIEAKLRIAAEVADAITALQNVRKELADTSKAASTAGKGNSGKGAGAAAAAETDQVVAQVKKRTQAESQAAAAKKQQDKEEANRQRELAKERKRVADEEERARKKKQAADDRQRQLDEAARRRTERQAVYNKAALAPQLNDIFVGLTTGQSPLTVALQQGPQITQIYGGIANTFRAVTAALTPMRLALLGGAAALGVLVLQAKAGYEQTDQLNKQLALSGNIVGTSLAQIDGLARRISSETGTSIGFVRDVLAEVVALGGQTSTTLASTGRAAVALSKLTGLSAEEAVKTFADQADSVTAFATKSNKAYNFLTAGQVAYIRSLEQQGRTAEAIKFTNEQLAGTLEQRAVPVIGVLERAWRGVGNEVSRVLDGLRSIGRDNTAEQQLKVLEDRANGGANGQSIFANLGEALKFGVLGGGATEASREYLEQLKARNQAELEAFRSQMNSDQLRAAERRAEQSAQNEQIKREAKEFQQIVASQRAAGAQQALAQREAELDAEKALIDRANAQELLSASDHALKLNAIEQRRAQAQLQLAQRLVQIEAGRTPSLENRTEVESQKAQLTQLQTQVVASRARVAAAVAEGQRLIDAEISRLDEALRRSQAENLRLSADRSRDPAERTRLEAEAATAEARRQFELIQRDISSRQRTAAGLAGSEGVQQRLQQQLDEARKTLDELTRRAQLDSVAGQISEAQQALATQERAIDLQVEQGATTTDEAEQRKFEAREKALPQLRQLLVLQQALAQTPGEKNAIAQLIQQLDQLQDKSTEVSRTVRSSFSQGFGELFRNVLSGSKEAGEGFKDFVRGIAQQMLSLITARWGEKLANSLFGPNAGTNGASANGGQGFNWGAFLQSIFASVNHTGGVIGAAGSTMRAVSPLVFAGAQVLHSGGLVTEGQRSLGLRPNEAAVIAEVGEEMLTEDNPRHIKNFRGGNGVVVQSSITVNGASGTEQQQLAEAERLQQMMRATVEQWAGEQRRQGGILAGVRRG